MPLTQDEVITRTRDILREASAREWSDDQLRRWINDGIRDLARTVEYMETTDTLAIVAGTQSYSLSTISPAIARIHRVEYKATGDTQIIPLDYEDYSNMDAVWGWSKTQQRARPWAWTVWGVSPAITFLLYPIPPSNATVTFYYYAIPDRLAETTTTDAATAISVPEGWESLITDYAEYHALRRDRDPRWQEAKSLYDEHVQHMLALTSRHSDQEGRIVPTGYGGVPAWLAGGGDY